MTTTSQVERKELDLFAQNSNLDLPRWCLFCIAEAKQHPLRRLTVVLCAEDECQCPTHDLVVSTDLIEGDFGGYGIKRARRPCPRKKPRRSILLSVG